MGPCTSTANMHFDTIFGDLNRGPTKWHGWRRITNCIRSKDASKSPPTPILFQLPFQTGKFLGAIPFSTKIAFTRDIIIAGQAIDAGVVASTTWTREKYWKAWLHYANSVEIDPLLQDTIPIIREMVLTAFTARVRQGYYGKGNQQIKVQSVSDAMAAISKTIELAGYRSPVYWADNKCNLQIERAVEGWRQEDPPRHPPTSGPSNSTAPNGGSRVSILHSVCKSNRWSHTHWFLLSPTRRTIHKASSSNTKWQTSQCYANKAIQGQRCRIF